MRLIDADALFESLEFPSEQWKTSFKQLLDDEPTVLSENKGEWIPVSERLPETAEYVLATDGLDMFVAWHNPEKEIYKGWHSFDELFDVKTPILAWQPLPEPYKAEKGGE